MTKAGMSQLKFVAADPPFMGATTDTLAGGSHAMIFGAPHCTPYPGIDNRVHEGAANAIRQSFGADASWTDHWNFDFGGPLLNDGRLRLADLGDLDTISLDGPGNREKIETATRRILEAGAVPLMIGGDDSVPIPFLAAFADHGPVTIIQVDAHIDWRDEREGERRGFSSTMRRASEMPHIEHIIQIGIRGFGSARREEVELARAWGATIVTAREIHQAGVACALAHVPAGARCVVSIDCDALDPSIMPAVMARAPGGLTYPQLTDLLSGIAAKATLSGLDVIEFVPQRDPTGSAAIHVASIVSHAIGLLAKTV